MRTTVILHLTATIRKAAPMPPIAPTSLDDQNKTYILVGVVEREGRKPATTKEVISNDMREVKKILGGRFSPANLERLVMGESVKIDNKTYKLNKDTLNPIRVVDKSDGTVTVGFGEKPKGKGIEEVKGN